MNTFLVLICGLNIRAQNRITLPVQLRLLNGIPEVVRVRNAGDKGSFVVTSRSEAARTHEAILRALRTQCPAIKGAAICAPSRMNEALETLVRTVAQQYPSSFNPLDFSLTVGHEIWRAGLAAPLFPEEVPQIDLPLHKTKNAFTFGVASGAALVAKREAHNVHWGTSVTTPCESQIKKLLGHSISMTSRSANIIRELVQAAGNDGSREYVRESS